MCDQEFEYDAFLSHAGEDLDWCERLVEKLRSKGVRVWFDKHILRPGHILPVEINEGIKKSRKMISVWSSSYFSKAWTLVELLAKYHEDPLSRNRPIIPVLIEDCSILPLFQILIHIDFHNAKDLNSKEFDFRFYQLLDALDLPNLQLTTEEQALISLAGKEKLEQQRIRLEERSSKLQIKLFGLHILDWEFASFRTDKILGHPAEKLYLQPVAIKPYCTSVLEPPVLEWFIPQDAEETSVELYQLKQSGDLTSVLEKSITNETTLNLKELKLPLSDSVTYNWSLGYRGGGGWIIYNGLFEILPSPKIEEFQKMLAVVDEEEAIFELDKWLLQAAALYEFQQYHTLIPMLIEWLSMIENEIDRIPFLRLLLEVYEAMQNKFIDYDLHEEADRVLLRIASLEEELKHLYQSSN